MDAYSSTIEWLLEEQDVSVAYRTRAELLGQTEATRQVQDLYKQIPDSKPVQKLLSKMHPEGYWLDK